MISIRHRISIPYWGFSPLFIPQFPQISSTLKDVLKYQQEVHIFIQISLKYASLFQEFQFPVNIHVHAFNEFNYSV